MPGRNVIQTVKIAAVTVFSVVGFAWGIWQFAASHYEAQIESLKAALIETRSTYEVLSRKAEGLLEPQLWKVDIILYDSSRSAIEAMHNTMFLHGGRIRFTIKKVDMVKRRVWIEYYNSINGIQEFFFESRPMDKPLHRVLRTTLVMTIYEDKFEFSVEDQKYYLQLRRERPRAEALVLEVYRLHPLY